MQNTDIMHAMTKDTLSDTLKRLLFEQNLKPTELARLTKVPQPTIQRIIAGTTARPHISSLEPIANYFKISVEQLKGKQPIAWLASEQPSIHQLPLLPWSDILTCSKNPEHRKKYSNTLTDAQTSDQSFATALTDNAMEPLFPVGTTLILDPERPAKDRSYVIAQLIITDELVFRQLITNGNKQYLRALSPELSSLPATELTTNDTILGVLVQAKHNFDID